MFVLAGGSYFLLRDDSAGSAAKTVPAPAAVSTPKQVKDILTATAKQTRTKVIVKRGGDAGSTRLVDTAERVVASSLYDKVHYRDLQFDDDTYRYDDGRSCYLRAEQTWVPVDSTTSEYLPAGRSGITYEVSEAGGKTTVDWSYKPAGKTRPTDTGTVVADSDTHLMLSASGGTTHVRERAVISYGADVAVPGKPGNICKLRA